MNLGLFNYFLYTLLIPFVIAFSMFAQKLQNPFLKPTPSFTSNSYSTTSYVPPLPSTYKYSNYNAIQRPKPSFFDSGSNNISSTSELNSYQKPKSSSDLGEILMNNPFNRPTANIFTSGVGNTYVPNNYAESRYQQAIRPSSYNRIQPTNDRYSNYTGDSITITNPYGATRNTPRKQDNYLSTSSADSAVTYINKIYEIDENDGYSVGSNPFLRKNLLQDKPIEGASKYKNSHDDAALKYIAHKQYDRPSYRQNNYLKENKQYQAYKEQGLGVRVNSKEKYHKYGYNQDQTQYKRTDYDSKKIKDKQLSYQPPKKVKNYQTYEFQNPSYNGDEYNQKPHFGSKQKINKSKKIKSYKQYEDEQEYKEYKKPQFGKKNQTRNQYGDDDDEKFDFQQQKKRIGSYGAQKNYQKDNYNNYDKYQQNYDYKRDSKQNAYKYSFKGEQNYSKPIQQSKRSKKQPQRIFFNDQQQSFSDDSREKKIKQYNEGPFQTLGGISKNQKQYESYGYERGQQGSKKLISSQVQEYQNHRVEEKLNEAKKAQQRLQDSYKQNSKYQQKSKKVFQQQYEQQDSRQKKSKGPVRDLQDSVPRVLEFNGMVFHRVEVK